MILLLGIVWNYIELFGLIVLYGVGLFVEGNFVLLYSGICVDFMFMDKILVFYFDEWGILMFFLDISIDFDDLWCFFCSMDVVV